MHGSIEITEGCIVFNSPSIRGSEPLRLQSKYRALRTILRLFKAHGINSYEVLGRKRLNVVDRYKYWTKDAIIADLDTKRHNFGILLINARYDINIGGAIRNANAFLAKEVILYGSHRYDKRGAVGTHNYNKFRHFRTIQELGPVFSEYDQVIAIENVPEAQPIDEFKFNKSIKTLFIFGQEALSIPAHIIERCDKVLYIRQFGSVRSLNLACATAIVSYEYTRSK